MYNDKVSGKAYFSTKWIKEEDGEKVYVRIVQGSKHYVRKYGGWGIGEDVLEELKDLGVANIKFIDKENNEVFRTTLETFLQKGIRDSLGGRNIQYFLKVNPMNYKFPYAE